MLKEPKALPMGVQDFHAWADHIIEQAGIPVMQGTSTDSQKFILADLALNLPANEDFKDDLYFIKTLRKMAVNQVMIHCREEIRTQAKARLEAETKAKQEAEANAALKQEYVGSKNESQEQTVL